MKLLIPILTDVLIVDDVLNNKENNLWARNPDNYHQVLQYQKASPPSLQRSNKAQTGVHLQWILPEFLCHGKQLETGDIEFPKVPNRWLIHRIWLDDDCAIRVKSWVVLSDYVHYDTAQPSNFLLEKDGELISASIGKVVELNDFQEQENSELFLTAVGPGHATFVNYTPNNHNVFSFIDELTDLENTSTTLSYTVSGWYSNHNDLPNLDTFDIDIPMDFTGKDFICHGGIYDVKWNGKSGDINTSISGKPTDEHEVIIANSSFDAIVRLVQHRMMIENNISFEATQQAAQLLSAFEHHLLDKIDKQSGLSELTKARHKSWFTGESGGSIWEIHSKESQQDLEEKLRNSNAYNLLNALNELQSLIDTQHFTIQSKQCLLYERWLLWMRDRGNEDLQKAYEDLLQEIQQLENEVNINHKSLQQIQEDLNQIIADTFGDKVSLKKTMSPNYWEANEPVILVNTKKTSDKYGFKKELILRTSNEIIYNLNEFYTKQPIEIEIPEAVNHSDIPTESLSLLREAILLNPTFSSYLYQQFSRKYEHDSVSEESIKKQQSLIWNDEIYSDFDGDELLKLAGYSGQDDSQTVKRPSLRAFSKALPTWSPMFLDWEIDYYPNGDLNVNNWKFNEYDYEFDDNQNQFDEHTKITCSGRSVLSTQPTKLLEQSLKDFKDNLKEESEKLIIDEVIQTIKETDIITQRLSGFNEMLVGLDINDIVPVPPKNVVLANHIKQAKVGLPIGSETTYPIRGGFLVPKTIRITDDFGLAIYPIDESQGTPKQILKSDALNHEVLKENNIVQLPPRIVQPSRLTLNWIGNNTHKPIAIAADDHPIIGWVMTDYLDKSVELFSPKGDNIGELIVFKREQGEVRWLPNDGQSMPNDMLNDFVTGILNYANSGSALTAFTQSIDDGLSQVSLATPKTDAFIMFFGQPLALVRASILLEVKGMAEERIKNVAFKIKISDKEHSENGVIGYFINNQFDCFYSNYDKNLSDYIKPIPLENIKIGEPIDIVLLMNPNGSAHLSSGILPMFEIKIPTKYTDTVIDNMSVSFRVGPIISEPDNLQIIKPDNNADALVWQQHGQPEQGDFGNAKPDANFPKKKNTIIEGWLKLRR